MMRRTTALENMVGVFVLIALVAIIGVAVVFGIRLLGVNRTPTHLLIVPDHFPTIQAAINAATAGDIVSVRAGTYLENLTLDKPISLTAETFDQINPANNPTIIDGGGKGPAILIPAGLAQMPTVQGFVVQNGTDGIRAQSQFIAEYNYIHNSAALVNYQIGAGGINRNNVYFSSGDDAIHVDDLNMPLVIENNRILYAGDDGIEFNLQNLTAPAAAITVTVRNNMIIGSAEDGIQFIDFANDPQDTNRRFELMGNLIANNKKAGIGLMPNGNTIEDYSGADTTEAIRAYNNTFYGNDYGVSGGDNTVLFNNIFVNSTTRGVWKVQGSAGVNSVVAYSLFFNNKIDAEQSSIGAGIIGGQDPLFQAAPNAGPDGMWGTVDDDFSGLLLQPASPAIDKGVTQYVSTTGEPIPSTPITAFSGAAPDLGWREYGSPAFILPGAPVTPSFTPPPTFTPLSPTVSPVPTFTPLPSATITATPIPATATAIPPTPLPSATPQRPTAVTAVTVTITPQMMISSISPNLVQSGATVNVMLSGSGFANGAVVVFEGGQGPAPQVKNTTVVNANTIVVTVNTTVDGSAGNQFWDVRVTNPDSTTAVLPDSFRVLVP